MGSLTEPFRRPLTGRLTPRGLDGLRRALLPCLASLALTTSGCLDDLGKPATSGAGGASTSVSASASAGGAGGVDGSGGDETSSATGTSASTGSGGECTPGTTRQCYTGPPGTEGIGACKGGVQACDAHGTYAGPCVGEVLPVPETCLTPVDDNCNGQINEGGAGCVCMPAAMNACYTGPPGTEGVGICVGGIKTCDALGTSFGPCVGEITPQQETCFNSVDDNCNGEVNESGPGCVCMPNEMTSCYTGPPGTVGVGACKAGAQACNALGTAFGPCAGEVTPVPETCLTPVDDNCNGQTNEGGVGCVCAPNAVLPCYSGPAGTAGIGACKAGTQPCNDQGTALGACVGQVLPQPEDCSVMVDTNCDGQVNEGCSCTPGQMVSCYTGPAGTLGVGICAAGSRTCGAQNVYGPCMGDVTPQPETCADLVDKNCNGQLNESCVCAPGSTASCYTGPPGTLGVGICKGGTQTCNTQGTAYGACAGEVLPQPESCVTPVDDNCNGQINEGCVCTPGATASCYTGPPGTVGVGICKGGTQTCNALGTAYGPCAGQVLPQPELCTTPADENCDGLTPACGALAWVKGFGSMPDDEAIAVAPDLAGNVFVGGYMNLTIDFGCGPLMSGGTTLGAAWFGKRSPTGTCLWAHTWGTHGQVSGATTDAAGNVYFTGNYHAPIDLGGGPLPYVSGGDVFIAKFDTNGNHLWSKGFGDTAGHTSGSIVVDAAGDLVTVGFFKGSIDFGGGPLVSAGGNDVYLAKLTSSGAHVWSKNFGDALNQNASSVTTDASGNIFLIGNFLGSIDLGGGPLTTKGLNDVFLAKLDTNGNHLWSKSYGDAQDQTGTGVATDASGNVYATGYFAGTMDFGSGALPNLGGEDIFLAKLDPSGTVIWSFSKGGPNNQRSEALAVDKSTGSVALIGGLTGTADFGGGTLTDAGGGDLFIARYDASGAYIWSARYGDPASQSGKRVAIDPNGNLLVTGILFGPTDFGAGIVPVVGGEDGFVAKFAP